MSHYFKRRTDGKIFPDITSAVDEFKCPGPCSPDCPLYPLVPKSNDDSTLVHMCHPDYTANHQVAVADRLGLDLMQGEPPMQVYAAVVKSQAVRDTQVCKDTEHDPMDDDAWYNVEDAEPFLGFYAGDTALTDAAAYAETDPENIRLIRVPSASDLMRKS